MTQYLLRAALLAMLLASFSAHATLITSLSNINIDGTLYNVTFHAGQSFNDLFDDDGDRIFNDNDGSEFDRDPTFWGDIAGAQLAAEAIMAALGDSDTTNTGTDAFNIPVEFNTTNTNRYLGQGDEFTATDSDNLRSTSATFNGMHNNFPIASFQEVPTPPTLALTALALGIMGFMGRRRRVC